MNGRVNLWSNGGSCMAIHARRLCSASVSMNSGRHCPNRNSKIYIWGPPFKTTTCSWLQFADNAVIIASNMKNSQQLLNIFVVWCSQVQLIWNDEKKY